MYTNIISFIIIIIIIIIINITDIAQYNIRLSKHYCALHKYKITILYHIILN